MTILVIHSFIHSSIDVMLKEIWSNQNKILMWFASDFYFCFMSFSRWISLGPWPWLFNKLFFCNAKTLKFVRIWLNGIFFCHYYSYSFPSIIYTHRHLDWSSFDDFTFFLYLVIVHIVHNIYWPNYRINLIANPFSILLFYFHSIRLLP